MPVSLKELHDAFQFVDMAGPDQNEAFLCLKSGKIYWRSELLGEQDPELPDDVDDEEKYIQVPGRRGLDLGKPLVLVFARQFLSGDYEEVRAIFSRRGAYAKFKALIHRRGVMQQWYDFQSKAEEEALRDWCKLHSIELID